MVEIRGFPGRERLMMVFKGQLLEEELDRAEQELRDVLEQMPPAFDMISDVSAAEKLSAAAVERIRRMGQLIVDAGLRTHVRVVGRSGQVALQFQRISRVVGYDSRLAYSLLEAEELLDASP
ncbi:MAG TPA: hypothetical protein VFN91_10020 [Myxococcaceae bacterium]|nr:hypothetical protein [Myxococcaceae bacterium]